MAGLENLFVTNPSLPQVQTHKLPEDASLWAEQLTTKIRELYPECAPLPISVEFKKKDEQMGAAVGALHVSSEDAKKLVLVPFVIRKFELSPLDVWMEAKKQAVHPLTNDTFKKEFFSTASAQALDGRPADAAGNYFNDPSTWNTTYPPLQGRYSYASAGYPLLDLISDDLTQADIDTMKKTFQEQPALIVEFQKRGHQELITKLAKKVGKTLPNTNDFAASAMKLIPVGVVSIKREGPDKYSLLQTADRMFDLMETESVSRHECTRMLQKITGATSDPLHDVDTSGEKQLVVGKGPEKGVFLYDDLTDKPVEATEFAHYRVKSQDGVQITGLVIPHVVDFSGKKKPYKLFLSPSHSSFQDRIAGVLETSGGGSFGTMLKNLTGGARVGQTGTFVFVDDGKAIATEPVTIKAVEMHGPITAIKIDGTKIRISRGYSMTASSPNDIKAPKGSKAKVLDVHGMIEQKPNEFIIPSTMFWIPMERFTELSSTPSDWLHKEAAQYATLTPTTIRYTGIVFDVESPGETKLALDQRRLQMYLATKGASVEKTAQIIKKAQSYGKAQVHGLRPLRKKADIVKEASEAFAHIQKVIAPIKANLIKCAAEIDQSVTVDALLGLNFLTPDNLGKFIAYKPVFEKIQDYLAELALASRLGLKDVSEASAVIGMKKIQDVVEGLSRVEAGLTKPKNQS